METGLWAFGVAVVSFAITAIIGRYLIPFLHKLNFGQTILDIGPNWHKNKQGTPTMGGIMFVIGIVIATSAGVLLYAIGHGLDSVSRFVFAGLLFALMNGGIGFIDDYVKVVKKRNLGLTAIQKLVLQFLAAAIYLFVMYLCKDNTEILIPFVGYVDLGFFYYIVMAVVLVGIVNAVNLTDGIDGLAGSVTFFACLFMMLIANVLGNHVANVLFAAAAAGGCLGFLIWNFHPAKCFMGDTGSLFLGAMVCAIALAMDMHLLLILIALVYLIEMFSVMLQVTYFKLTHGKRLFKMSPIHHHFEMCGWSEMKIVCVFSAFTALCGLGALLLVIFG
ncbi:phospho-N-acetylmuramoyl-pentapeptide-transferase [Roseburia sp. MSJ-14]|uniref:phospho-N-acetylmuramoyl-pentapeptide- transferase n=1 Tax=Roseburia sp. MSJ-14 TaxID=2841514 RepID=UPI001C11A051|nr:phospho-N-acetylmuramoyl-pentapeptide-transferase [Roseburia sp. MSJ-14]MBU5474237.1 phospho-N-acetylmuramoyl-pentapeptide-transferase [Roseburia sp. MSJ-14]